MPTLGQTTSHDAFSASTANKTAVSLVTATEDGTLDSATARMSVTGGSANAKFCVYADSGGAPGAKIAESNQRTVTNTTVQAVNFTFSGANRAAIVSGSSYWIGPSWQDPGTDSVNYYRDTVAGGRKETSSYAPSSFGTPTTFTGPLDAYLTYLTSVPEDPPPGVVEGPVDGAFFAFFDFWTEPPTESSAGGYPASYPASY